jgi:hypothetical protein
MLGSIAASERTRSQAGGHRKANPLNPSLNKIKRKCNAEGSLATITQTEGGGYGALDCVACNLPPLHPWVRGFVAGPTRCINVTLIGETNHDLYICVLQNGCLHH